MKAEAYNFHEPGRLAADAQERLSTWLRSGCVISQDKWAKNLPFPVEVELASLSTVYPSRGLAQLPDASLGYQVALEPHGVTTLLVLPRSLSLVLVSGMLGDTQAQLPPDRALTPVEDSLLEFLVQDLMAGIQESWTEADELRLRLLQPEPRPKRTHVLPQDQSLVICEFSVSGPFGQEAAHWLIPRDELEKQLLSTREAAAQGQNMRSQLEALTRELPVEISVELGCVDLPVAQLADLRAGDLVILNQHVSAPLIARVAGEDKFHVWPGRVGSRQALQVESLVDE